MISTDTLEERLSRPSQALIDDLADLDGDIMILGAGGKMGPSLARMAARAGRDSGTKRTIRAVSRWSDDAAAEDLAADGVEIVRADLEKPADLADLEPAQNVVFMVGRKFGTAAQPWQTWWTNAYLPAAVAERFPDSRFAVFSTGNVYPLLPVLGGGPTTATPPAPVGEYGQAALARERMFERAAEIHGTKVSILRLNYAIELRYGVLVDIGRAILDGRPVDVSASLVNVCWQGWANSVALRSLRHADSPPTLLNLTGPETASVEWIARELAERMERPVELTGEPGDSALLNNAARTHAEFGYPDVTLGEMLDMTAEWLVGGGTLLDKPTHFEVRTGRF
jgi:nucleoside-diphosphate-sugar epimerase